MNICLLSRSFDLRRAGIGRFSMELYNGLKSRGHLLKTVETDAVGAFAYFIYTGIKIPLTMPRGCGI